MQRIEIKTKDLPVYLRFGSRKQKAFVVVTDKMTVPMTAGLWEGGSRSIYSMVKLSNGNIIPVPNQNSGPWDPNRNDRTVAMDPGFAMVRESIFCGKESPLTFYIHEDDFSKFSPGK